MLLTSLTNLTLELDARGRTILTFKGDWRGARCRFQLLAYKDEGAAIIRLGERVSVYALTASPVKMRIGPLDEALVTPHLARLATALAAAMTEAFPATPAGVPALPKGATVENLIAETGPVGKLGQTLRELLTTPEAWEEEVGPMVESGPLAGAALPPFLGAETHLRPRRPLEALEDHVILPLPGGSHYELSFSLTDKGEGPKSGTLRRYSAADESEGWTIWTLNGPTQVPVWTHADEVQAWVQELYRRNGHLVRPRELFTGAMLAQAGNPTVPDVEVTARFWEEGVIDYSLRVLNKGFNLQLPLALGYTRQPHLGASAVGVQEAGVWTGWAWRGEPEATPEQEQALSAFVQRVLGGIREAEAALATPPLAERTFTAGVLGVGTVTVERAYGRPIVRVRLGRLTGEIYPAFSHSGVRWALSYPTGLQHLLREDDVERESYGSPGLTVKGALAVLAPGAASEAERWLEGFEDSLTAWLHELPAGASEATIAEAFPTW